SLQIFHINLIFHKATKKFIHKDRRRETFSRLQLLLYLFFTVLLSPPLFFSCIENTFSSIHPR
ncbi:hypothetical protein, partial [Bacteroides sp.]|uniref:hypothetical protein n=1 Tax=Bacteroides sp. TaxID=29523 RepID=UPI00258D91AD